MESHRFKLASIDSDWYIVETDEELDDLFKRFIDGDFDDEYDDEDETLDGEDDS